MTLLEGLALPFLGEAKTVRAALMELMRIARAITQTMQISPAAKKCPTCKSGLGHCYDLEGACSCRCYEQPCETRVWARKSKKNPEPVTGLACTKIGPHAMCSVTRPFRICLFRRIARSGWCDREDVPDGEDFCSDHQPKKRSRK